MWDAVAIICCRVQECRLWKADLARPRPAVGASTRSLVRNHPSRVDLEHPPGALHNLSRTFSAAFLDGAARNIRGAGGIGALVKRREVRVSGIDDHFGQRHAQRLRGNLS